MLSVFNPRHVSIRSHSESNPRPEVLHQGSCEHQAIEPFAIQGGHACFLCKEYQVGPNWHGYQLVGIAEEISKMLRIHFLFYRKNLSPSPNSRCGTSIFVQGVIFLEHNLAKFQYMIVTTKIINYQLKLTKKFGISTP